MPAVTDGATGTVAGVRNPAGKEPAGGDRWRCGDRYGYLDIWSLAGEVVIAPAGLMLRVPDAGRHGRCHWHRGRRPEPCREGTRGR